MLKTRNFMLVPVLSAALIACGDDDTTRNPGDGSTPPPGSIAAVASASANLSTLVTALGAADLVDTLSGPGPFTVFAPTNAAFAALPAGTLDALLADKAELTKVLTYHVISGKVTAADVVKLDRATTVEGSEVRIAVDAEGGVMINGAMVTTTDIQASNGVIHVIEAVLLPPKATPPTIVEAAQASADLSTLVTAVQAAGLVDTLNGPGPFTVFAPNNAAFDALPAGALDGLLADQAELAKVLTYHVVSGAVRAADVVNLTRATTVEGRDIEIAVEADGTVRLNGVRVLTTDIEASNGVIHIIEGVLLPPKPSIAQIAQGNPDFSTLVTALQAADLVDTMVTGGPFTVFAPTNAAFDKLPDGTLDALLADKTQLQNVLLYHVIDGTVNAADVVSLTAATTKQGSDVSVTVDGTSVKINDANVTQTDIEASNGVVHVIDTVLIP